QRVTRSGRCPSRRRTRLFESHGHGPSCSPCAREESEFSARQGGRGMTIDTDQDQATGTASVDEVPAPPPKVMHLTVAERAAHGRGARGDSPRTSHSALDIAEDRDPVAVLGDGDAQRVPELVPIRYGRMLVSPFAFYRGAAAVMA